MKNESSYLSKRALVALLALLFHQTDQLFAQPFEIGHAAITFIDAARNNRSIPCEIYYPAEAAGDNVPVASSGGNYPVASFGHGFVMSWDAYKNIWDMVVPEGFILVFPKTETGFMPNHLDFGLDLAFVITQMRALGQDDASIFHNRISMKSCVMGHSMGGGASFLAARSDTTIAALVTFAPAETSTSAIQAATEIAVPALVFAGSNDCVTPPATNQLPMYEGLASDCKKYINITGGSHCQMANSNFPCTFGESTCTPTPAISREEQHQIIKRYLLPWLNSQLKGDCQAGQVFDASMVNDTSITYQSNCELCPATGAAETMRQAEILVFPNPFSTELKVNVADGIPSEFKLFDLNGRKVLQQSLEDSVLIKTQHLRAGVFFYEIRNINGTVGKGKLVKQK